jgi:hypothetical protein
MQHWFVYYKLEATAARQLESRVQRMQREIASAGGVRTRLLRRVDGDGGLATLMEVYEGIGQPAAFESTLAAAVASAGLPAALLAQRRTERFEVV